MSKKKPYCLLPWIHFHVGDDGNAKACCIANIPFGNINTQDFDSIWNGDSINSLRKKFALNIPDNRCAQCIKLEEAGGKSIRQETFEKFNHMDISYDHPKPIYFDIRFSNVCNLKCRTCWHGASSSWFEDAKKLGTNKSQKAIIKNIHDYNNFIVKLGPHLLHAEEIYFAGGEPLVTEEHYQLLEWLIEHQKTHIKLRYNTNFTFLKFKNYDILKIWDHFENIELMASIDATGDLNSYIRSGSQWDKIINNFKKIKHHPKIKFKISPTVSVLNIEHLIELYQTSSQLQMITEKDLYINILERPIHYNIQTLSLNEKQKIDTVFKNFMTTLKSAHIQTQFQEILQYMWSKDLSKKRSKFHQFNDRLDQIRNEKHPV
jgi:MoaA/NifB/PqqE/SkfB family radical SAM enzyme